MLIYCPKCFQGYNVDESLIPEKGRKLRCGGCGEVFRFDRTGAAALVNLAPKTEPKMASKQEVKVEHRQEPVIEPQFELKQEPVVEAQFEFKQDVVIEPEIEQKQEPIAVSEPTIQMPEEPLANNLAAEVVETAEEDTVKEPFFEAKVGESGEENIDAPVDMNDIFKRLAEQTEGLFAKEKKLSFRERLWLKFKTMTGWNFHIKAKYVAVFAVVLLFVSLYNNRYDISRKFPWLASVYGVFGVESQVLGEGLEFQNINWVFFNDGDTPVMEINGFINNTTQRNLDVPVVRVEMLDENTGLLKSQNQETDKKVLAAKSRMPLKIIVSKPSPTTKYVFLTFVEVADKD